MRIPSGTFATFWARSSANSGAAKRPRLISCATPTIRATAKRSCRSMKRSWKRRRRDTRTHFPSIAVLPERWRRGTRRNAPACRWKSGCALCSPIPKMLPNRIKSIWKKMLVRFHFPSLWRNFPEIPLPRWKKMSLENMMTFPLFPLQCSMFRNIFETRLIPRSGKSSLIQARLNRV